MTKVKVVICPYCGETQPAGERCRSCLGVFEPLSRQATHNAMGPWYVRDENRPHQPGCSYETLVAMVDRGRINKYSILRGPTTKQFWTIARHVPGVAHLLGYCHNCDARVDPNDLGCAQCAAPFGAYLDRNALGLPEVRPLPWEDSDGSQGDWGGEFAVPRPQARGVSSFARDDEIGTPDRFSAATAPSRIGASTSTEAVEKRATGASLTQILQADDSYYEAKLRSTERRLADQHRNVKILLALLLVTLLIALLAAFGVFTPGNKTDAPGADVRKAPEQSQVSQPPPQADKGSDNTDSHVTEIGGTRAAQTDDDRSRSYEAEYERALALINNAADSKLPLDDRLARLSEAIAVLKNLRDQADSADLPGGLDELIAEQERQHRRLELQKYFPD